jgi:uncharacterized protein YkwD
MSRTLFTLAILLTTMTVLLGQEKTGPAAHKDKENEVKLSDDEKALVELTNKSRAEEKLAQLKINPLLCKVARQHTLNMCKHEKMAHVLDGKSVAQRVTDAGYDYRKVGENLAKAYGDAKAPASPPTEIHKKWMESKGHRAHILEPKYTEIGINMALSEKGTYYYTVVYAVPRKKPEGS